MPLYDYACRECDSERTLIKKMDERNEPTEAACPSCGSLGSVYIKIGATMTSYSHTGTKRTDDDFNSRLKIIRDNLPAEYRGQVSNNIR